MLSVIANWPFVAEIHRGKMETKFCIEALLHDIIER